MNGTDAELLALYAQEDSQAAFAELVTRHLDLVYSAARRQVGSPHLAEEIAQSVFLALARQARRGPLDAPLGAWLYVVTRRTAVDAIRRESRQRARERAAAELSAMNAPDDSPWVRIEPILDEAMDALPAPDRSALVLRFFESKSLREVGAALGATEDAAQKRISRALEELRAFFARRGVTMPAAALAAELTARAVVPAPLSLGTAIVADAAAGSASFALLTTLAMNTTHKIIIVSALVLALGAGYYGLRVVRSQQARITELQSAVAEGRSREQRLRTERKELLQERQAAAGPAATALPEEAPPAPAARLRNWLATMPQYAIPELALLKDEDWVRVVQDYSLETERDFRRALNTARAQAQAAFGLLLAQALRDYAQAQAGMLPSDVSLLAPYFNPPVDPAIFARYTMLESGAYPAAQAVPGQSDAKPTLLVGERPEALVDEDYESRVQIAARGFSLNGASRSGEAYQEARRRYSEQNNGREPTTADELLPYLPLPMAPQRLDELFRGVSSPARVFKPGAK